MKAGELSQRHCRMGEALLCFEGERESERVVLLAVVLMFISS